MPLNRTPNHPTSPLSAGQTALARSRLYALFGLLYRKGLTVDLLSAVASLPGLAEQLPQTFDADAAAAEHFRLLGRAVPPHASLFLDPAGLLGGPVAEEAAAFYARVGFAPDPAAPSPDALSEEMALLAFLAGAEADAWEDAKPAIARRMAVLQGEFLTGHLLPWLPPFVLALRDEANPLYSALAQLTLELAAEQLGNATRIEQSSPGPLRENPPNPPPVSHLLEDEGTGLREIAAFLTSPPRSGLYLSGDAITRLGREVGLPRGFGPRAQMLETLLRTAAQYEAFPPLLARLDALWQRGQAGYTAQADAYPHLLPFLHPWQERCTAARALLRRLGEGQWTVDSGQ